MPFICCGVELRRAVSICCKRLNCQRRILAFSRISSWLEDLSFVALRFESVVKGLLPARFGLDDVVILSLELARRLFLGKDLLHKGLLPVLLVDAAVVELSRAFDNSPDMTEGGNVRLGIRLFVVALRVQHVSHLEQLKVAA
jgi:hypothetical protein